MKLVNKTLLFIHLIFLSGIFISFSAPPPNLPGEEITQAMSPSIKKDTLSRKPPTSSPYSIEWYDEAAQTWDAPSVNQQLEEDETPIPIGKGAVFIPYLSDPSLEPDIVVYDSLNKVVSYGKPGKKICLIPGTYCIHLGSGSLTQRIKKWVVIEEAKTITIFPTWSGLQIDIVNENNIPFRGSYEMVRLDEFEPFGRTYGRDPNQGERIKTWILKPGLYKIFSVGSSYNTVNNYVTVRLLPGELVHFVLVEEEETHKIISGGVTVVDEASKKFAKYWRYGLDIGGSILFNTNNDTNSSAIVLLTNIRVNHKRYKGEWDSKIFFDQELNFTNFEISQINNTADDFRIYSLYIWRILQWLGPYGRLQYETHFFPVYERFSKSSTRHLFIFTSSDSTVQRYDSVSSSVLVQPSFSPMSAELGVGANVDVIARQHFDSKIKLGFGYSQRNTWNQKNNITKDTSFLKVDDTVFYHNMLESFKGNIKVLRTQPDMTSLSYGPEAAIYGALRIGNFGIAEGEIITRIPIIPLLQEHTIRPDYKINTIVSWRITRSLTLDYLFMYTYSQPSKNDIKIDLVQHRVWLRFSFNTSK